MSGSDKNWVKQFGMYPIACWTIVLILLLCAIRYMHRNDTVDDALRVARDYYALNLEYRKWNADLGGVYALSEKVAPNPHLTDPHRDVVTLDGTSLTLINPAYMTRMVFESISMKSKAPIINRLVSLKPLNPVNKADEWEQKALQLFESSAVRERHEIVTLNGQPYLKFISAFITGENCLKCHAHQGYQKGDIRGGMSISIPLSNYFDREGTTMDMVYLSFMLLWISGSAGIAVSSNKRFRRDEALEESEQKYRDLVEHANSIILRWSNDGKIIFLNEFGQNFFGYTSDEIVGRHVVGTIVPENESTGRDLKPLMEQILANPGSFEQNVNENIRRDGERVWIAWTNKTVLSEFGEITEVLSIGTDITEQRQLTEKIRHTQRLESIGQLAGGIAHDFNNILTVISGYAHLLQEQARRDKLDEDSINHIISSVDRATALTRGLLAFSRKQQMYVQRCDLNKIVSDARTFLSRLISADIELSTNLNDILLPVNVDTGAIEQIVINLVTNARDAMPNGGKIFITTGIRHLDDGYVKNHSFARAGAYALITVSDTGSGMDKATCDKIFDPFFTTKDVGKGTGLGLAIAYGILKQHDGYINVYSEMGIGTVFKVYLPLHEDSEPAARSAKAEEIDLRGRETILVIEDDEEIRKLITTILPEFGYTVMTAVDGEDGIEKFREHHAGIQLVLTDVIMPKKSGVEVYTAVKDICPSMKIILISGYTSDFIADKGGFLQDMTVLLKPLQPTELLTKIKKTLASY